MAVVVMVAVVASGGWQEEEWSRLISRGWRASFFVFFIGRCLPERGRKGTKANLYMYNSGGGGGDGGGGDRRREKPTKFGYIYDRLDGSFGGRYGEGGRLGGGGWGS